MIVTNFPKAVRVIEHTLIPLKDGTTLDMNKPAPDVFGSGDGAKRKTGGMANTTRHTLHRCRVYPTSANKFAQIGYSRSAWQGIQPYII